VPKRARRHRCIPAVSDDVPSLQASPRPINTRRRSPEP
jgi:hypothetical protein